MASAPQLNPALAPLMLKYVELSSALTKRALDELVATRKVAQDAAAQHEAVLEAMIAGGTIQPAQKQAAAKLLLDPVQTLALLKNAAAKIGELKAAAGTGKSASDRLGEAGSNGDGVKAAHDPNYSLSSPYVGERTTKLKASDMAMIRGLGLEGRINGEQA